MPVANLPGGDLRHHGGEDHGEEGRDVDNFKDAEKMLLLIADKESRK